VEVMMKLLKTMLLSAALVAGTSVLSAAQYRGGVYRNDGYQGPIQNSGAYQQGWRDAQDDASHGRHSSTRVDRYHNDADRAAYDQGYAQGYQAWVNGRNGTYAGQRPYDDADQRPCIDRDRDGDCDRRDDRWRGYGRGNSGYYGQYGGNGNGTQVARQFGFRDGVRDGQNDRASGHSFRPTSDDAYRFASNGYQGQFGSRDQYKHWYRSAYEQGYQQGYSGNGSRYGWRR
jgi:hypothetical protein